MRRRFLLPYVFCTGGAVLALEISASRLLAPYFGASLFVWSNVIGVVLAALAAGYYVGGRLADKGATLRLLGGLTWAAGLATCAIPLAGPPALRAISLAFYGTGSFLAVASLVAMTVLFALPLFLLGALSPLAARLGTRSIEELGSVNGTLTAAATAGSLAGAFLPTFLTIPLLGTRATILGAGAMLIVMGAAAMRDGRFLAGLLLPLASFTLAESASAAVLYERESPYQHIRVIQRDDRRWLVSNEGLLGPQTVSLREDGLTGTYTDAMAAFPFLFPRERPIRVLVVGLAGGSVIRQIRQFAPDREIAIDAVEIDPLMPAVARAFFGLEEDDAEIIVSDGRAWLNASGRTYDIVLVDAFRDERYIPFHLATREFFDALKSRLAPDGVVAANVFAADGDDPLLTGIETTMRASLGWSARSPIAGAMNFLIVAAPVPTDLRGLSSAPTPLRGVATGIADGAETVPLDGLRPLTDDRAPVEFLTDRTVRQAAQARRGR